MEKGDLIRREDARVLPEELSKYKVTISPGRGNGKEFTTAVLQVLGKAQLKIDQAPAVDAVEVVRCKDCMHYICKDALTPGTNRMRCNHPDIDWDIECYDCWIDTPQDGFCYKGERRDGGAE